MAKKIYSKQYGGVVGVKLEIIPSDYADIIGYILSGAEVFHGANCGDWDKIEDMLFTRENITDGIEYAEDGQVYLPSVSTLLKRMFIKEDYEFFNVLTSENVIISSVRYFYRLVPEVTEVLNKQMQK